MALNLTASASRVEFGTPAALNNLNKKTVVVVFKPSAFVASNRAAWQKSPHLIAANTDGTVYLFFQQSNTALEYVTTTPLSLNAWWFLAFTYDDSLASARAHIYMGQLGGTLAEASYTSTQDGVGTMNSDSAAAWTLANRAGGGRCFPGDYAFHAGWNRALSFGELQAQFYRPHVTAGCVLFCHLGFNGTGAQADWSGNAHNGTVQAGSVADHAPMAPLFYGPAAIPYAVAAANFFKTVADAGGGADILPTLAAAFGLADAGAGADTPGNLAAQTTVADAGGGADGFTLAIRFGLADTGGGADSAALQRVLAAVLDAGGGLDAPGTIRAAVRPVDTGIGLDSLQAVVSLAVGDTGGGLEGPLNVLKAILARIADAGAGLDGLGGLAVTLAVAEAGGGADWPAVTVQVAVTDAGAALEAVGVLAAVLVRIQESAAAADGVRLGPVQVAVTDSGGGTEQIAIMVSLALADAGGGAEAINRAVNGLLATVADAGHGADTVGQITVNLALADSGLGVDRLAALLAGLAVADTGAGVETAVTFDASVRIVAITFTFLRRRLAFALAGRSMEFGLKRRAAGFALTGRAMSFELTQRAMAFGL